MDTVKSSPVPLFEHPLEPYQRRVVIECDEVELRLAALEGWIASENFRQLHVFERDRLRRQCRAMNEYRAVLKERIAAFGKATA